MPKVPNDLQIKPFGDWVGAYKVFSKLSPKIKEAVVEAQAKVGLKIVKKVQSHLARQDLGWKPLNKRYKAEKTRLGVDTRTLLSRWTYFKNIKMWHRKNGWDVYIGVKKGIYGRRPDGKKNKYDVSTIAIFHEFGRRGRKRPLWGPTMQELGGKRGIRKLYKEAIASKLKRSGLSKYLKVK